FLELRPEGDFPEVVECEGILLLHPLRGFRGFFILKPAVRVDHRNAEVGVDLPPFVRFRIVQILCDRRGGAQEQCQSDERKAGTANAYARHTDFLQGMNSMQSFGSKVGIISHTINAKTVLIPNFSYLPTIALREYDNPMNPPCP